MHPSTINLYLIYGYREIAEPNRWYVGSCLYIREQIRDNEHRRQFGAAVKFRRELKKTSNGRCFDEIVERRVLEVVWGTPQDCVDRENIHMDRLDSIENGFNSCHAGFSNISESNRGRKRPKELVERIASKLRGKPNPKVSEKNRGKKRSKAFGDAVRNRQLGKKRPGVSKKLKGRKRPEQSKRQVGNKYWRGKKWMNAVSLTPGLFPYADKKSQSN